MAQILFWSLLKIDLGNFFQYFTSDFFFRVWLNIKKKKNCRKKYVLLEKNLVIRFSFSYYYSISEVQNEKISKCLMCKQKNINTLIFPCKDLCYCYECGQKANKCLKCNKSAEAIDEFLHFNS